MREVLSDIIRQTSSLFDKLKVTGTEEETVIRGEDESKVLFLKATLTKPAVEFQGEFGIPNLSLLSGLLNFANYKTEDASFNVTRKKIKGVETVTEFEFRDANGVGADFRTMSGDMIQIFGSARPIPWDIKFSPDKAKIAEFSQLAGLYSEVDKFFTPRVQHGNLVFDIGGMETSGHRVSTVFARDVEKISGSGSHFSSQQFLSMLKIAGSYPMTVCVYGLGIIGVEVETPHAQYNYYLRHNN